MNVQGKYNNNDRKGKGIEGTASSRLASEARVRVIDLSQLRDLSAAFVLRVTFIIIQKTIRCEVIRIK